MNKRLDWCIIDTVFHENEVNFEHFKLDVKTVLYRCRFIRYRLNIERKINKYYRHQIQDS